MSSPERGAYRMVISREMLKPGVFDIVVDEVWCPQAVPSCLACLDFQAVLGPEDGCDVMDCPDCLGRDMPEWDAALDGPREVRG